ncbi:MAG: peptide ABC transporter substrate-binding protein, partial [Candidatus Hydrogenedentota bacterium]
NIETTKNNRIPQDEIIIGMTQEPDSLDPVFSQMAASSLIQGALFEAETERNEKWDRELRLAEKIPSLKDGDWKILDKKRMETIWKIKPASVWEDGHPLTVFDSLFVHKIYMDPDIPVTSRDVHKRIENIEIIDSYSLRIVWKERYHLADYGIGFLPSHILEPVYKSDPKKYHQSFYNKTPIGNGPYKLSKWVSGVEIVLEKNELFFFDKPFTNKLIFRFIPDSNTLLANLLSGTIDASPPGLGITFDQAIELEKQDRKDIKLFFTPGLIWEHIDFNLDNPLLKDKLVRKALLYAINRKNIIEKIFFNKVEVAHSWLPPKHYGYYKDVSQYEYNPEKAKELLIKAGWKWVDTEKKFYKDNKLIVLTIMTTAGNKLREQVEQIIQSDFRNIGIELNIKNQPANVFFGQTTRYRKFPDLAMYAWVMSPESDGESLWTSDNIPSKSNNFVGQNTPGWQNKEIDRIDHLIPQTLDESERKELFKQEQIIWSDELPAIPLFFRLDISVVRAGFENWLPTGTTNPVSWNCEYWKLIL